MLIDLVDYPDIPYGELSKGDIVDRGLAGEALPSAQYAFAFPRDNSIYLARDPLGCNKLFFGAHPNGNLVVANRITRLWRSGVPLAAVASCPPGHLIQISSDGVRKKGETDIHDPPSDLGFDIAGFQSHVRAALQSALAWLARTYKDCRFLVTLSGGLDSSLVASFAAAHLPNVTAVSFTYLDNDDLQRHGRGARVEQLASASEDICSAAAVAVALGIPLLPVVRPRQAVVSAIRPSIHLCQDWRDFNVHCATVNLFLAQDIRAVFANEKVVVLTGDLMNEYVCDYHDERVEGTVYYKIPRIPIDKRRKHFVRGLDAGDREIGVFWGYGLIVCQVFAVLAEHYMRIPASMLDRPASKWTLNGPLIASQASAYVNQSKTRAQVGGKDLGTLGMYHRLGIGEQQLRQLWHDEFPGEPPTICDELIQFGRYKLPRYAPGS
jgi:asparagine synthetase B (glutamine-hydrolysing)